jgi:glutamate synthase (NADPH/NADH) small chain
VFIRKLRFRNLQGAARAIKERNALGGVCAVVCPTEGLCESRCVASGIGEPIRIGKIQRFLVEWAWDAHVRPVRAAEPNGWQVAVVGAGPSGLTCAAQLAKAGVRVVVFDKRPEPGGMLAFALPEHRLSRAFVRREIEDIRSLGVEFRCSSPVRGEEDLNGLFEQGFRAVYLATGTWRSARLGLPTRGSPDVIEALAWLEQLKREEQGSRARVRSRKVIVVGGGDTAIDAAVCAKRAGAREVSLLYRRSFLEMPASRKEILAALDEGIHLLLLTQPMEYVVRDGVLEAVRVVRTALQPAEDGDRPRPVPLQGTEHTIPADVVIEAPGLLPGDDVTKLSEVELDRHHRIIVRDAGGATSRKHVFAGGDAVRGASIVAKAVGDGQRAARAILDQLGAEGREP